MEGSNIEPNHDIVHPLPINTNISLFTVMAFLFESTIIFMKKTFQGDVYIERIFKKQGY